MDSLPSPPPVPPAAASRPGRPSLRARLAERLRRAGRRTVRALVSEGHGLALLILAGMTWAAFADVQPLPRMRVAVFDQFQRLKPREAAEAQVLVVDIDERSLAELGQWPWPRTTVGQIVETVMAGGAKVFGFDALFSEPDRLSPPRFADTVPGLDADLAERLRRMPSNDQLFGELLKRNRAVLGVFASFDPNAYGPKPARGKVGVKNGDLPGLKSYLVDPWRSYIGNIEEIETQATGRGLIVVPPEEDSRVRRVALLGAVGDDLYPTLGFEMLRIGTNAVSTLVRMHDARTGFQGISDVVLQGARVIVPTDPNGRVWPHFAHWNRERYISALDIHSGQVDPSRFRDKYVILGASAQGLRDIRSSPVDDAMPGVELHAQLIESILSGSLLTRPEWAVRAERLLPAATGLVMILGMAFVGATWTFPMFLAIAGMGFSGSWYLFEEQRVLMDATWPVTTAFVVYLFLTYVRFTNEEKSRRYIKNTFGFFLSPALVEKLAGDPSQMKLGGELKELTILFSDVRGFTSISEVLTAEQLTTFMNRYLTPMTDIAQANGAYIDKYIGDAVMAFWNAPLNDPDHAANACRTVLQMRARLAALNEELRSEFQPLFEAQGKSYPGIAIGMGLNSGDCVVGNMGSTQKFNYSVLGDAVNLASRLEGQTKGYGVDIIIGETTRAAAPDFAALEADLIRVKGKRAAVRIFTLAGGPDTAAEPGFAALAQQHAAMLACYRAQDWDGAEALLAEAAEGAARYGVAGLHALYAKRIADYRQEPPPAAWDGVYTATTK
ncbi:MAG TPA: adenylate/guanylate cyclase domain-containing protein [Azospirillaceae bacterium]|nr:adenylate/guanylate cyclase domain-containing protein [Azospirillaceae bacterium]